MHRCKIIENIEYKKCTDVKLHIYNILIMYICKYRKQTVSDWTQMAPSRLGLSACPPLGDQVVPETLAG